MSYMVEITLIGPEGKEIYVDFDSSPDKVIDLYLAPRDIPEACPLSFRPGKNPTFVHAEKPALALAFFEAEGYQPTSEEERWFRTGQWE